MSTERLLETFLDLVRIDSPTGEEGPLAAHCAELLGALGFDVVFDDTTAETGSEVGNLIATRQGSSPQTLVLSAHLDCVEPCRGVEPVVEDGVVRTAGDTVLCSDDKAGIAAIIESIRRLAEGGAETPALRVVLTVSEETGLTGAKALADEDVVGDVCLVLDAAGAPGGIVVGTPTHYTFTATFQGQAAHAGVEPESGISAIRMAADAISSMELGRLDDGTTANIGTMTGGTATNVIAASAELSGECRSLDPERVEEVRASMEKELHVAAERQGGTVDVAWRREYTGFRFEKNDPVLELAEAACHDAGLEPREFETGGGSDGNVFAAHGVPTLVLAAGMSDVHGTSESIRVEDLESLTRLMVAIARRTVVSP
jgi:tripeptide aminopeptidase